VGAGTAGGGGGTRRCQRCPRPISGPPAAVSFRGLLVYYGTTDHGKPTAPGAIPSLSFTLVIFIISGGCTVGQRPTARGGSGERAGATKAQPFPRAASGRYRDPGIRSSLPNRTPPTCIPRRTSVASRPPTGRAIGVTDARPSPLSAPLAVCRRQWGEARGGIGPNLPAGSSWVRRIRGGYDEPGSRRRPASQVEWSVLSIPAAPEGTRCQASAWFAGTSGRQRFLEGLDRLPGGSRDSKSLAQVFFLIPRGRHIVVQ
jgi:hypothetical protein